MSDESARPKLYEVVLGANGRMPRHFAYAGALALTLHVGGGAAVLTLGGEHAPIEKRRSQPLVVFEHVVELEAPPPPKIEPPPQEAPPPRAKAKAVPPPVAPAPEPVAETPPPQPEAPEPPPEAPPSEPPPAAQAGQVVAAETNSPASFQVVTGTGNSYAGGTTISQGTGSKANHTGQIGIGEGNGLSRARAAQLRSRNWPCGWPPEAEDLDIEESYATIRAAVRADGSLGDVEVLSDPGHGFGKRAVWCARTRVKFDPALDAAGRAIDGTTPPLRVHFVREE